MRSSRSARDFELADTLARDAEPGADLFERLRLLAVETEAEREHTAHPRVQLRERSRELLGAEDLRGLLLGLRRVHVLDQVAVEALAVADRNVEADRVVDELEQVLDALLGQSALVYELLDRRLAVELLGEHAA